MDNGYDGMGWDRIGSDRIKNPREILIVPNEFRASTKREKYNLLASRNRIERV